MSRYIVCDVKASPLTTYMDNSVHMAATDDVFDVTNFVLSIPTGYLGWGLRFDCVSFLDFSLLTFAIFAFASYF